MYTGLGRHRWATWLAVIPSLFILYRLRLNRMRTRRIKKVPKQAERILILGATSGIGRSVALLYSERGGRVCVVGRREALIDQVVAECQDRAQGFSSSEQHIFGVCADFSSAEDMLRVRDTLEQAWQGFDTLVVAAGVSALQPLLAVAGVESKDGTFTPAQADAKGIQRTIDVATAALRGNYLGPLVSAVSFVPLLASSSKSPSILLVSSLASLIPPPTRTLYASTKAASLMLYQALAIEHPSISFTNMIPATVEGDFRASAVDGGPVRELDPNQHGLKREDVARRCITAVDRGERIVYMPSTMRMAPFIYWIWPTLIERIAKKKYNFQP